MAGDRHYVITINCIHSEFHDAGFNMKPAISVNGFPDKQLHFQNYKLKKVIHKFDQANHNA